jgi:peptidoglycan/LPS O-acetylase OafA/YrhL
MRAEAGNTDRQPALDALRGATTLLVVLHHTAITYGAMGGWYWRELPPDGTWSSRLLVLFCSINQAWFMGLFFLLAGYFTPGSLQRRGVRGFGRERLLRLGLPLLFYGFVLGPMTIALAGTARGHGLWQGLMQLWREGRFENGPLWFAQALLLFSAAAALVWRCGWYGRMQDRPWPGDRSLLLAALTTGVASLALRQWWPVGVNLWGLQLGYFASYAVLFAFGCWAAPRQWLQRVPVDLAQRWWRVAVFTLPVLPLFYLVSQRLPVLQGKPMDTVYAFWEPLVAWGVILRLLMVFQRRFAAGLGPWWAALSRRAFAIYIVHPPVLVAVALAGRGVPAPALLKFAVTGSLACALCFVIAGWLLRLPGLRRVL